MFIVSKKVQTGEEEIATCKTLRKARNEIEKLMKNQIFEDKSIESLHIREKYGSTSVCVANFFRPKQQQKVENP